MTYPDPYSDNIISSSCPYRKIESLYSIVGYEYLLFISSPILMLASKHYENFDNFSVFGAPAFAPAKITGTITKVIDCDTVDILTQVDTEIEVTIE